MTEVQRRGTPAIMNSIIVPVYNEAGNIKTLIEQLKKELSDLFSSTEIIFVDDNSSDNTAEIVGKIMDVLHNVKLESRKNERGLSSAVVHGFKSASGQRLVCMDGDLQHPPAVVVKLLEALEGGASFVVATRYFPGTDIYRTWSRLRILISKVAQALAFPISRTSDPMSGFFALSKPCFMRAMTNNVNCSGFKIGLELLVKSEVKTSEIKEVGYKFGKRVHGQSKLTSAVVIHYLTDLLFLYLWIIMRSIGLVQADRQSASKWC